MLHGCPSPSFGPWPALGPSDCQQGLGQGSTFHSTWGFVTIVFPQRPCSCGRRGPACSASRHAVPGAGPLLLSHYGMKAQSLLHTLSRILDLSLHLVQLPQLVTGSGALLPVGPRTTLLPMPQSHLQCMWWGLQRYKIFTPSLWSAVQPALSAPRSQHKCQRWLVIPLPAPCPPTGMSRFQ